MNSVYKETQILVSYNSNNNYRQIGYFVLNVVQSLANTQTGTHIYVDNVLPFGVFFFKRTIFSPISRVFSQKLQLSQMTAAAKNDLWFEFSSPFKKPATLDDIEINERGQ